MLTEHYQISLAFLVFIKDTELATSGNKQILKVEYFTIPKM